MQSDIRRIRNVFKPTAIKSIRSSAYFATSLCDVRNTRQCVATVGTCPNIFLNL